MERQSYDQQTKTGEFTTMQKFTIRRAAFLPIMFSLMAIAVPTPTQAQKVQVISKKDTITELAARKRSKRVKYARTRGSGSGVVVSHKTGARATVSSAYAPKFQAYIDDLETNYGARVLFMGGIRRGPCHSGSLHPCGRALDVCQHSRGVVESKCNLPGRVALGALALKHGLFEGGMWCNHDYGHVQAGVSAVPCANNIYAAVKKFKLIVLAKVDDGTDPEAKAYELGEPVANIEEKTKLTAIPAVRASSTASARSKKVRTVRVRTVRYATTETMPQWGEHPPLQYQQNYQAQQPLQYQQTYQPATKARRNVRHVRGHHQRISKSETITFSAKRKVTDANGNIVLASTYWEPQRLAGGGWLNTKALAAAHKTLPLGTWLTLRRGSRSAVVVINDRGPYVKGRTLDLTPAATKALRCSGLCMVRVEPWPPLPKARPDNIPQPEPAVAWGVE